MYQRNFDCPPPKEASCKSVTTLEKMIIEAPCGEDLFTGCVPKLVEIYSHPSCKNAEPNETSQPFQRRIWIAPKSGQAAYIYFEEIECEAP
jgi:hypothetical protein